MKILNCIGCSKEMECIHYIEENLHFANEYHKCVCGMQWYNRYWYKLFYKNFFVFKMQRKYSIVWRKDTILLEEHFDFSSKRYSEKKLPIKIPYNITYKQLEKIIKNLEKTKAFW